MALFATSRTSQPTSAGEIYALIRDRRDITRTEIGQLTGLSRTAVSARVAALAGQLRLPVKEVLRAATAAAHRAHPGASATVLPREGE